MCCYFGQTDHLYIEIGIWIRFTIMLHAQYTLQIFDVCECQRILEMQTSQPPCSPASSYQICNVSIFMEWSRWVGKTNYHTDVLNVHIYSGGQ